MIFVVLGGAASAQTVSEKDILQALSPPSAPRTRSLSAPAPSTLAATAAPDAAFVDSLRNRPTRSLSVDDREKLGAVAATKPKIDLAMEFDYNSDTLRGDALATADKLGKALSDPTMKGQTFMIAGHTDARGTDASNQKLSERRADAVKQYLVSRYDIPAANLITVGYGKSHLKNPSDPDSRENRRVQTVNMLQMQTAGR